MWTVTALTLGHREMVRAQWKVIILLILLMVIPSDGLFHSIYRSILVAQPFKGNAGQPLFLSPYIRTGKIKEGEWRSENCCYPLKCILFHFTAPYLMVFWKIFSMPRDGKYTPVFYSVALFQIPILYDSMPYIIWVWNKNEVVGEGIFMWLSISLHKASECLSVGQYLTKPLRTLQLSAVTKSFALVN